MNSKKLIKQYRKGRALSGGKRIALIHAIINIRSNYQYREANIIIKNITGNKGLSRQHGIWDKLVERFGASCFFMNHCHVQKTGHRTYKSNGKFYSYDYELHKNLPF